MSAEPGRFVTGSTMRHVVVMTVSGSLGLLFMFLVDFAALWWVSQLGVERIVAAVGIAWTIQFAAVSVSIGLMIAAVALVSRALGAGRAEEARRAASASLLIAVAVQTAVAVLVWIFRRDVLAFSGAEGETLDIAASFLAISLPSLPLMAIGMVSASVLRAAGDAWRAMTVTMAAGALAMVMDPLFILVFGLGSDGAAMVISLSRIATAAYGVWLVQRFHGLFVRPTGADVRGILHPFSAIAGPAIATQMATPFGNWVLTRAMAEHGDSAVAGWGVVTRLSILVFGGIFALSGAIGGIFGQNYGAGRIDRVQQAYADALVFCAGYVAVAWALLYLLQGAVVASFGLSAEGAEVVRAFSTIGAGAFVFYGALFVSNVAFNNLGRPLWSTGFNWLRDGVLMFPCAVIVGGWFGAPGVIYAQAVAGAAAGLASALVGRWFVARLGNPAAVPTSEETPGPLAPH